MATDLERLVVSLEARIVQFEKNMQRAGLITDREMRHIEQRIDRAATVSNAAFRRFLPVAVALFIFDALKRIGQGSSTLTGLMNRLSNAWAAGWQSMGEWVDWVADKLVNLTDYVGSTFWKKMNLPGKESTYLGTIMKEAKPPKAPKEPKEPKQEFPTVIAESDVLNDQLERLNKNWEDMKDVSGDVFKTMVDDVKAGKDAIEILTDALTKLEDKLLSLAEQKLLDILFGSALIGTGVTPGGGILGTTGVGAFFRGLAGGGDAMAGRPYIVGEKGPELFVPNSSGTIVPSGRGVGMTFAPVTNIDARGADAGAEQRIRAYIDQSNRQLAVTVKKGLPGMLAEANQRS